MPQVEIQQQQVAVGKSHIVIVISSLLSLADIPSN